MVTGASSDIGAAVARALVHEGAHVALAARREDALLEVQAGLDIALRERDYRLSLLYIGTPAYNEGSINAWQDSNLGPSTDIFLQRGTRLRFYGKFDFLEGTQRDTQLRSKLERGPVG